jgi:hypothetical protein
MRIPDTAATGEHVRQKEMPVRKLFTILVPGAMLLALGLPAVPASAGARSANTEELLCPAAEGPHPVYCLTSHGNNPATITRGPDKYALVPSDTCDSSGTVTSTCPFKLGSGWNGKYAGHQLVELQLDDSSAGQNCVSDNFNQVTLNVCLGEPNVLFALSGHWIIAVQATNDDSALGLLDVKCLAPNCTASAYPVDKGYYDNWSTFS